MTVIKWTVGTGTQIINNLSAAAGAQLQSSVIDNTSNLFLFDDVELDTGIQTYSAGAGAVFELYLIRQTISQGPGIFEDGSATIAPPAANLVGVFNFRSTTAAQYHVLRQIPIPPTQYFYVLINKVGGAITGISLWNQSYSYQSS